MDRREFLSSSAYAPAVILGGAVSEKVVEFSNDSSWEPDPRTLTLGEWKYDYSQLLQELFSTYESVKIVSQSRHHLVVDTVWRAGKTLWEYKKLHEPIMFSPIPFSSSSIVFRVTAVLVSSIGRPVPNKPYGWSLIRWHFQIQKTIGCGEDGKSSYSNQPDKNCGLKADDKVRTKFGGPVLTIFGFTYGGREAWCGWDGGRKLECFKCDQLVKV